MHSAGVHKVIALIISVFYLIGFWHRGDKPTVRELRLKFVYCLYYLLYAISLAAGAIGNENEGKAIFLVEASIGSAVLAMKLWLLIWKQSEICDWLNRVCVFKIQNDDDYNHFNGRIREFMKFVVGFLIAIIVAGASASVVSSCLSNEKILFVEIEFPIDYKNNEIAFWIATVFITFGNILMIAIAMLSIIIWYLLLMCSLRYNVLGRELKRLGRISGKPKVKMTEHQKHFIYFEELKESIDAHLNLKKLTDELGSYFANIFLNQFATSGLCICGSIYCLAFDIGENLLERLMLLLILLYYVAEIFMITYFGNEIKLSSDRLSYSLFESNWYNQPQSTQKCIIAFGEYLKKPQELVVGKLYPLTLETFTRILNSAYSMFNILTSFQQ